MSGTQSQLPEGWESIKIVHLCDLINGRAFKPTEWTDEGLPIIRIQNLNNLDAKFNYFNGYYDEKHLVQPGDLLFAWSGTPGTSFGAHVWRGGIALLNQHIFRVVTPNGLLDKTYLRFAINRKLDELIHKAQGGVGLRHVTKGTFESTEILLPPLAEQQRIVAKIEALQERSRRAREALAEVAPLLEQFRQSVLAAAFRGDLTTDWRAAHPDVEPASELLYRISVERRRRWEQVELAKYEAKGAKPPKGWQDKYEEPEPVDDSTLPTLPNGWKWVRVKDIGKIQLGRQRAPQYHSGPNMRPYLRVMNVFEDRIDTEDIMEMDFSPEEFERYRLEPEDILLNEGQSRELVGRSAIYRGEIPGACFTNTLVRFRPDTPIESDYPQTVFLGYLKTGRFQQLASLTVNIAHLGAGRFADMAFPLPPLEEQAEIVRRARGALRGYPETL